FMALEEDAVAGLVAAHFGADANQVITSSRTFPPYLRVDLDGALQRLFTRPDVRCVGVQSLYGEHLPVSYATIVQRGHAQVAIAPLRYDEIDIGDDTPVRCLHSALWLLPGPVVRHGVLYTRDQQTGWKVEIIVPPGEAGDGIVTSYFAALERALL